MRKVKNMLVFVAMIAFPFVAAHAYKEGSHSEVSKKAFKDFSNVSLISQRLGISVSQSYTASDGTQKIPADLVGLGAFKEDELTHSLMHFYNPQSTSANKGAMGGFFISSREWAIDGMEPTFDTQNYSYADAREAHFLAVAGTDQAVRVQSTAKLFEALGHIVHHIEDMAQPQHVRDDIHCDLVRCLVIEAFSNGSIDLHQPSYFELKAYDFISKQLDTWDTWSQEHRDYRAAVFVAPRVFATPYDYWENAAGTGMAQFTSKNFVSEDTSFTVGVNNGGPFIQPNASLPLPNSANVLNWRAQDVIPQAGLSGDMNFVFSDTIFDPLVGRSVPRTLLAAYSIFNDRLTLFGKRFRTVQNMLTVESQLKILLPRTIALASGFIDFFFRGDLSIVSESITALSDGTWKWRFAINNNGPENIAGGFIVLYEDTSNPANIRRITVTSSLSTSIPGRTRSPSFEVVMPASTRDKPAGLKMIVVMGGILGGTLGADTKNVSSAFTTVLPPSTPVIPCGGTQKAAGGSVGSLITHEMGNQPGNVPVEFEAFDIPDSLTINADTGKSLVMSGLMSGRKTWNIAYDPNSLGTTKFRTQVVGNTDQRTWWQFTVGCPGASITNNERVKPLVRVSFSWGCTGINCYSFCRGDMFLDGGSTKISVSGVGGTLLDLTEGIHDYRLVNFECEAVSSGAKAFPVKYRDNAGEHALNWPQSTAMQFLVK